MGQRLSDDEETINIRQLGDFLGYWRNSPEWPSANSNNDHVFFPILVVYNWENGARKKSFSSVFRAFVGSGPDDGTIDIDATSSVTVDRFHLNFKPVFQNYRYDSHNHTLAISHTSGKMGRYSVLITAEMEEP